MSVAAGNLFDDLSAAATAAEQCDELLSTANVRIERIVSRGHASRADFWYDQDRPEWVLLVSGSAELLFEGERAPRRLKAGDYIHIPAHARHRVAWTDPTQPTIWLAVHHR